MGGLPHNPVHSHLWQCHGGGPRRRSRTHTQRHAQVRTSLLNSEQEELAHLVWVVEDVAAQVSVQELVEVGHQALSLHSPLPRRVHPLQLVAQVTHLGCHITDVLVQLLEMLEGHLR